MIIQCWIFKHRIFQRFTILEDAFFSCDYFEFLYPVKIEIQASLHMDLHHFPIILCYNIL